MTAPLRPARSAGILLHPTSLPGPFGIGDLGPAAYQWVDALVRAKQKWWQVLPLGPTGYGDSPYQCFSACAGNPYLVSPEFLDAIWAALTAGGLFYLATDHDDYFAAIRTLMEKTSQFRPTNSEWSLPVTTFEKKFVGAGVPIHRLILRKVSPVR